MENNDILIVMFIFSGICFLGGLISGYVICGSKLEKKDAGQG
jgi:hypothetical protein